MKKIYTAPEVCLVKLGDEMMAGLEQGSVNADGDLPGTPGTTGPHIGSDVSDGGDDPEAKISGRFWDDEY